MILLKQGDDNLTDWPISKKITVLQFQNIKTQADPQEETIITVRLL